MEYKDYYSILGLSPSSSVTDIKKAYRELAMKFHPDKNSTDLYASAQFNEIKEAYDVLSNSRRKQIYLQQRWYNKSAGVSGSRSVNTPVTLLKKVLELDRHISQVDIYRLDKKGLFEYLDKLISTDSVSMLNNFNDLDINDTIIIRLLPVVSMLCAPDAGIIFERMKTIQVHDETKQTLLRTIAKDSLKRNTDRYSVVTIALITLLICLLIFFWSK